MKSSSVHVQQQLRITSHSYHMVQTTDIPLQTHWQIRPQITGTGTMNQQKTHASGTAVLSLSWVHFQSGGLTIGALATLSSRWCCRWQTRQRCWAYTWG